MYTLFNSNTKRNIRSTARRRDGQNKINVISSYSNLPVINYTKRHYVGSKATSSLKASLRVVSHLENNFSVTKKCVQEYFQSMVLSIKVIIMQVYLGSARK